MQKKNGQYGYHTMVGSKYFKLPLKTVKAIMYFLLH